MRAIICLTAVLVMSAGSTAAVAKQPAFQLTETTWTFTDTDGTKIQESIDAKGNFIANALDGKHVDHGTSRMSGDKACFTSAMTKDGEVCWTTKPVKIGETMDTVNDKGKKLTVKRVAYLPMSIKLAAERSSLTSFLRRPGIRSPSARRALTR